MFSDHGLRTTIFRTTTSLTNQRGRFAPLLAILCRHSINSRRLLFFRKHSTMLPSHSSTVLVRQAHKNTNLGLFIVCRI